MQSDKTTAAGDSAKTIVAAKATPKKAAAVKKTATKTATKKAAKKTAKKTSDSPKKAVKTAAGKDKLQLRFEVFFTTKFGESIHISGAHPLLGAEAADQAPIMQYIDDQKWAILLEPDRSSIQDGRLRYTYLVRGADGSVILSAPYQLEIPASASSITIRDAWNAPGYIENAYATDALQVIQGQTAGAKPVASRKKYTHRFIITAPALETGKAVCLIGDDPALGGWEPAKAIVMAPGQAGRWSVDISLKRASASATAGTAYKYGIYDLATGALESFETGDNRILEPDPAALLILQNGFIRTN